MVAEVLSIAGLAISGIGLFAQLSKDVHDFGNWDEQDLPVDRDWLDLAIKQGILESGDYRWRRLEKVPIAELSEKASTVIAYNEEKRVKYRIVRHGRDDILVLMLNL